MSENHNRSSLQRGPSPNVNPLVNETGRASGIERTIIGQPRYYDIDVNVVVAYEHRSGPAVSEEAQEGLRSGTDPPRCRSGDCSERFYESMSEV
jgi:hypothetical protein